MASGDNMRLGGGTDWSKYSPIYETVTIQPTEGNGAGGTSWVIKEITGEGYLTDAYCYQETSANSYGYIQITLDGVIVCKSAVINIRMASGILSLNSLVGTASSSNAIVPASKVGSIVTAVIQGDGYVASRIGDLAPSPSYHKNLFLNNPLFFKTSCKVEFISWKAFSPMYLFTEIRGGLKTA